MTVMEDWEHGNEPENEGWEAHSGVSIGSAFDNQQADVWEGSWAVQGRVGGSESGIIVNPSFNSESGSEVQAWIYLNADSSFIINSLYFGASLDGSGNIVGYALNYSDFAGEIALKRHDGSAGLSSGTTLSTTSASLTNDAWYQFHIDWNEDGSMTGTVYDDTNTEQVSVTATDTNYTSGSLGFGTYYRGAMDLLEQFGVPQVPASPTNLNAVLQ